MFLRQRLLTIPLSSPYRLFNKLRKYSSDSLTGQALVSDWACSQVQPGDLVWVKKIPSWTLEPKLKVPNPVVLTIPLAVKVLCYGSTTVSRKRLQRTMIDGSSPDPSTPKDKTDTHCPMTDCSILSSLSPHGKGQKPHMMWDSPQHAVTTIG